LAGGQKTPHVITHPEQRKGTGRGRGHVTTAAKSVRSRTHLKQTTEQEPVLKIDMSVETKSSYFPVRLKTLKEK